MHIRMGLEVHKVLHTILIPSTGTILLLHSYSMITHAVSIMYQKPWISAPPQTSDINTVKCWETTFYILTFYVLIRHMYFNLNNV
jgi:hypothetical protein